MNQQELGQLIAQAAAQRADLVVLPETLTVYGLPGSYVDAADPIPGPSTDYFAGLAKQHQVYLVVGLVERGQHLICPGTGPLSAVPAGLSGLRRNLLTNNVVRA